MAGQEGLEPTTRGFGIRCSTIGATALNFLNNLEKLEERQLLAELAPTALQRLLSFAMTGVLTAELAEFFEFQLVRRLLLVLGRGIVLTLTSRAI